MNRVSEFLQCLSFYILKLRWEGEDFHIIEFVKILWLRDDKCSESLKLCFIKVKKKNQLKEFNSKIDYCFNTQVMWDLAYH